LNPALPVRVIPDCQAIERRLLGKLLVGGRAQMRVPPKNVETRAAGRPPEEGESENPGKQAEAILEDSEGRLENGVRRAAPEKD
jgi:hypothetical protein